MYKQLYSTLSKSLSSLYVDLIHFRKPWRKKIIDQILAIKKERNFLLTNLDAFNIARLTISTNKLSGAIVEIGAFNGCSAKLISQNKIKSKEFYVIDSFEGLPEETEIDRQSGFKKGDYKANLEDVKAYLSAYENVKVLKGFFPQVNSEKLENLSFSFVHLDIDLYAPTLECLEFFYSRMERGGVIISHDFQTPGIQKAFDEFFSDKPEIIIELMEHQGMIVKF